MSLNTEIISVGTELLLGHVTNTDARDVSEELSKIGINVLWHTVVGDNPTRLENAVKIAKERADIIITTGGLGPTCDDITKQITAKTFGVKLVRDENEVKSLHDYISGKRIFTDNNYQQADVPEGGTIFHNTCGTAPGCAFKKDGKIVAMLPGPPKECRAMLNISLIPYLKSLSDDVIISHSVNIFGIGESRIDDMFSSEMNVMTNPTMAPYAKECDCLLQITAKAKTEKIAEEMCGPVIEHVKSVIGEYVFGIDTDTIEKAVFNLLGERTIAIAESMTGGSVSKRFSDIPESEKKFAGAIVNARFPYGCEETVKLAESVKKNFGSDFGLAVTYNDNIVFTALSTNDETFVKQTEIGKDRRPRSFVHQIAGNHVYDMLRRYLEGKTVISEF